MILAGCFTIPHELTQLISRRDIPRFKFRPPFRLSVHKRLGGTEHRISAIADHLESASEYGFDPGVSLEAHL
jgi:hypothetical protein